MAQIHEPVMDLPPAYYSAIGEFLFRFAQLEYQLHEIIWKAFKIGPKVGRTMTIGTDIRVLCGMIGTITGAKLWITNRTHIQEMNGIANGARSHSDFRNSLAHGSWQ